MTTELSTSETQPTQPVASVDQTQQTPPPATSTQPSQPAVQATEPAQTGEKEPKTISMPTAALKKLKADERRKAEKQLLARFGVQTQEELEALLAAKAAQPKKDKEPMTTRNDAPVAPAPVATPDDRRDRELRALQKRARELEEKNAQLAKKNAIAEKRARELRRQQDERAADFELRQIATECGVKDTDYALFLLRKHIAGKSPSQLQTFDAAAYFKGLQRTVPHIFSGLVVPAGSHAEPQTPAAASDIKTPPAPPSPKDVAQAGQPDGEFNAMKASPEEVKARLKNKYGVTL